MKLLQRDVLSSKVYDALTQMMYDGRLSAGERLNKKELCESLGVSMTPINEAVNRLIGEGIVEQQDRGGYYIRKVTSSDLEQLFLVRAGIEGVAVWHCIETMCPEDLTPLTEAFAGFDEYPHPFPPDVVHRYLLEDQRFHRTILELAGNDVIDAITKSVEFMLKSYQPGLLRPPDETYPEHRAIIEAIRKGDSNLAKDLVIKHHLITRATIEHGEAVSQGR
jgi:GntR family transcriptional regulator, rspAB operon transcriptional repressor